MLIRKIVSEDYVDDDWFLCAMDGWEELKDSHNLCHLVGSNRVVSENVSLIAAMVRGRDLRELGCVLTQPRFQDHHIAFGSVSYMPTAMYCSGGLVIKSAFTPMTM